MPFWRTIFQCTFREAGRGLARLIGILTAFFVTDGVAGETPSGSSVAPAELVRSLALDPPGPSLIEDESIARAAERHASEIRVGDRHANLNAVQAALAQEGLVDTQFLPFAAVGNLGSIQAQARTFHDSRIVGHGFNRLGVALLPRTQPPTLVVFFVRRLIELPPLPDQIAANEFILHGVSAPSVSSILAFLLGPTGRIDALEVARAGRNLSVVVPIEFPGAYRFELLAESGRGPEVAALWRFSTPGTSLASTPAVPRFPEPRDRAGARRLVLTWLNRARRQIEQPPLGLHPSLGRAAEAHAEAICLARLAAHVLPGGDGPEARARAVGYTGPLSENVALAPSLRAIDDNLMGSPSHRRNVIDPDALLVGIGVAERGTGANHVWCIVELFQRER